VAKLSPFLKKTQKSRQLHRATEQGVKALGNVTMSSLEEEAKRATEMLSGKTISLIHRHRSGEVLIEFTDGTRLFVDRSETGLELSITGERE